MNTSIHNTETMYGLEIAVQTDGSVNLEQGAASGSAQYVSLHRSQVQLIAEKVGLLRHIAPDGGAVSGQTTHAEIVREQRRLRTTLLALRDRGETLLRNLEATEQYSRDDLTLEVSQAAALCDIADLACKDFESEFDAAPREAAPRGRLAKLGEPPAALEEGAAPIPQQPGSGQA